jgi:DNA replication ATP-dependent helicase Dna2
VEENIFSPMFGLKGKIDATVQINMEDEAGNKTLIVPFELKTGKENISHQAQTALYTLLLSDRYGELFRSCFIDYANSDRCKHCIWDIMEHGDE